MSHGHGRVGESNVNLDRTEGPFSIKEWKCIAMLNMRFKKILCSWLMVVIIHLVSLDISGSARVCGYTVYWGI